MSGYIVGVDIGTSKVCAALGKYDRYGELQILGITSVICNGLKKGIVVDIDSAAQAINNCIQQLERMADIKINNAYISIPGGICELVNSTGVISISSEDGKIKSNDIERVHKAAKSVSISSDKQIIGIMAEKYAVDGYSNVKDPLGMSGIRLEVEGKLVIVATTVIDNLCKSVGESGIKIDGIVLNPSAISEVVLKKEEKRMGTALIDVGAETIDISVYKDENLVYTSMVPLGGNSITNDIAICLKVPYSSAEELKVKHDCFNSANLADNKKIIIYDSYNHETEIDSKILYQITEARVEELLVLIKRNLINSGLYEDIINVVIVGGGLALLTDICDVGMNILKKPVRIGKPNYAGADNPSYSVVCGILKDRIKDLKGVSLENNHEKNSQKNKSQDVEVAYDYDEDEKQVGILKKIKEFLTDFF